MGRGQCHVELLTEQVIDDVLVASAAILAELKQEDLTCRSDFQ